MKKMQIMAGLIIFAMIDALLIVFAREDLSYVRLACLLFINISFTVVLMAPIFVPKSDSSYHQIATSTLVSGVYLILELIVGIAIFVVNWDDLLMVCIIQCVLLGITSAVLLLLHSIDVHSAEYENKAKEYREEYVAETRENMSAAFKRTSDAETKKIVEKTCDRVASMPRKNKAETIEYDENILQLSRNILGLAKAGNNEGLVNSCKEMNDLIEKRNTAFRKSQ